MIRSLSNKAAKCCFDCSAFCCWFLLFIMLQTATTPTEAAGAMAVFPTPLPGTNVTEQSLRQSVCDRYTSDGSSELRHALSGLALRPILTVSKFFRYNDTHGVDDENSLVVQLLDELAARANFTWRDSFAVSYGPEGNQTWTEMLQLYTDMYDISIDYWDKSGERLNRGIAFVDRWFDGSMILIERIAPLDDEEKVNYTNFMRPFTPTVWLVILATGVASSLIYMFLEWLAHDRDNRRFGQWFQDNLFLSALNFSQNYSYEPVSPAGRIFGFSMAIWAMVLGATYTANLASLFVEEIGTPAKTADIAEAIRLEKKICTWAGTNSDLYIKRRYPHAIRIPMATEMEAYQALHTKKCDLTIGAAASWEGYKVDSKYNPTCDLEWVGRTIEEVSSAFAVKADPALKCTNLIRDVLNYHLNEMASDLTLEGFWDAYYAANRDIDCLAYEAGGEDDAGDESAQTRYLKAISPNSQYPRQLKSGGGGANPAAAASDSDPESSSLSMSAMAGTFVLHAVLSGFAILVGIVSAYRGKAAKIRKNWQDESISSNNSGKGNDATDILTDESTNIAARSLVSGICAKDSTDRYNGLDKFEPNQSTVQEQLILLQASQQQIQDQQEEMAQQMSEVVLLLTKMQTGNS